MNTITEIVYYFSSGAVLTDLIFAGDNAFAIVLAANTLRGVQKIGAIAFGVVFSFVLRITMWDFVEVLTKISGFILVAGLVAFWIAWRSWAEATQHRPITIGDPVAGGHYTHVVGPRTMLAAVALIIVADIGFTGENVVALSAGGYGGQSTYGSLMSTLMKLAAAPLILKLIDRYRWITLVGITAILMAGVRMAWDDLSVLFPAYVPAPPSWMGG